MVNCSFQPSLIVPEDDHFWTWLLRHVAVTVRAAPASTVLTSDGSINAPQEASEQTRKS